MDEQSALIAVSTATARCLAKHEGVEVEAVWDSYAGAEDQDGLAETLHFLAVRGKLIAIRGEYGIRYLVPNSSRKGQAMEKREVVEVPGLPKHDGTVPRLGFLGEHAVSQEAMLAVGAEVLARLEGEILRLRSALRMLGGLQDDAGVTHASVLHDHAAYARGVLAGADPADVEGAIREGER